MVIHIIAALRLRNKYANKEFQISSETMQTGKIYKHESKSALVKTHAAPLTFLLICIFRNTFLPLLLTLWDPYITNAPVSIFIIS